MNKVLFDANSTNTTSATLYVAPGSCILINAWNLGVGETAQVFRLLVAPGSVPADTNGSSCSPTPPVTAADILQEEAYQPCNAPVEVGQTPTQNINSIVLSQPGYYNLHLTPAALGTAFVEAVFLTGEDACEQAAETCCCGPAQQWNGTSANPCLTITPGGVLGLEPVFDIDACCLMQQIVTPGIPNLVDTIVVFQGGACIRATLQDIVDLVFVCGTLGGFPLGAVAPLDSVVVVDSGAACKRLDFATAVSALETPWAGVSTNPFLTITPGGVNGHAPTFGYDWCGDLQALPSCACEPNPGDLVPIVQGGACVLAAWPVVDLCDQIGLLTLGVLIGTDLVPVREAGGACKVVAASDFAGGGATFPLLAPSGSCAAPSYSFTASPDSGLWYNTGNGAVTLSDDNCSDFIEVGASINVVSSASNISLTATIGSIFAVANAVVVIASTLSAVNINGATGVAISATAAGNVDITSTNGLVILNGASPGSSVRVVTNATERLEILATGGWEVGGNQGVAGQVLTSAGPGLPPTWAPVSASVTFPLLAPTSATPQYSFLAQPGMGMAMDGAQLHFGSLDTVSPVWPVSSRLSIDTGVTGDMQLYGSRGDGSRGANLLIHGGDAINPGLQVEGGGVQILGGNSNQDRGGSVSLQGGSSSVAPSIGAVGGDALVAGGDATQSPGNVNIRTAASSNVSYTGGGHITLRTDAYRAGIGPSFRFDHRNSQPYGYNCLLEIPGTPAANVRWAGLTGDTFSVNGQTMEFRAGISANILNTGRGGDIFLYGGNAFNNGNQAGGGVFLAGGAKSGTATQGYVNLEMRNAAQGPPTGTPNLTGGYAPLILHDDGVNINLYAYCPSAAAWQSVILT